MGLLRRLVMLPVAPVEGVVWLARNIQEMAEQELHDPARLRAHLQEAEDAHRRGDINDDELAAIEDEVLQRLVDAGAIGEGTVRG